MRAHVLTSYTPRACPGFPKPLLASYLDPLRTRTFIPYGVRFERRVARFAVNGSLDALPYLEIDIIILHYTSSTQSVNIFE